MPPATAQADGTGRSDDPRVGLAIGVPKSATSPARWKGSDKAAQDTPFRQELCPERQCRPGRRVPRWPAWNECRGSNLVAYRMPTPPAHPMNDGLSLYPQAGAVSLPSLYLYIVKFIYRAMFSCGHPDSGHQTSKIGWHGPALRPLSVPATGGAVVWSELPPEEKRPCAFTSIRPSESTATCWRYSRSWQLCSWLDPESTYSVKASTLPCKRGSSPGRLPRSSACPPQTRLLRHLGNRSCAVVTQGDATFCATPTSIGGVEQWRSAGSTKRSRCRKGGARSYPLRHLDEVYRSLRCSSSRRN
jgi:hypothetical protein